MSQVVKINEEKVREIESQVMENGILKVMPSEFYRQFDQMDLFCFCAKNGIYGLPTFELLNKLNELILEASPTRNAIEIGSGCGVLGRGLGIQCTDNHMQSDPMMQMYYAMGGQEVVQYGEHVAKISGNDAVDHYRPEVVVACWVTHLYREDRHELGGNMFGVDEELLVQKIKRYVFVGNLKTHAQKPLLNRPHKIIRGDFIFSKSVHADQNVILVWDNS